MSEMLIIKLKRWVLGKIRRISDILRDVDYANEVVWNDESLVENSRYSMSTYKLCRAVKKYLVTKNLQDKSIIDVGCGKGKMLEFFRKYRTGGKSFKRVAGVDFSKELCEIASQNMKTLGINCEIYCADATLFDKYSEFDFFYMFNPMKGELLRKTVKRIKDSALEKKKDIHIIYCNPWSQDILIEEGYVVEQKIKSYAVVFKLNN